MQNAISPQAFEIIPFLRAALYLCSANEANHLCPS